MRTRLLILALWVLFWLGRCFRVPWAMLLANAIRGVKLSTRFQKVLIAA